MTQPLYNEFPELDVRLQSLARDNPPKYQAMINVGERCASSLVMFGSSVPGLLRLPAWVGNNLIANKQTSVAYKQLKYETLVARQNLTTLRRRAGDLAVHALMSTRALETCGSFAFMQASRLLVAPKEPGLRISFVDESAMEDALQQFEGHPICAIRAVDAADQDLGVYWETKLRPEEPTAPHEWWETDAETSQLHRNLTNELLTCSLGDAATAELLQSYIRR